MAKVRPSAGAAKDLPVPSTHNSFIYLIDGEIKIQPIMYLALSNDHRIVDGKEAVSFLKNVKDFLEEPKRLFLNV